MILYQSSISFSYFSSLYFTLRREEMEHFSFFCFFLSAQLISLFTRFHLQRAFLKRKQSRCCVNAIQVARQNPCSFAEVFPSQ